MKTIKKSLSLFFSIMMLISAIPISATAEENLNTCTNLYDSLSLSGELKTTNNDIVSKLTTEIPLTEEYILDIDNNRVIESMNLSSDDVDSFNKVNYSYNSDITYESTFDNGAVVSFNNSMEMVAYSNFDRNGANSQTVIENQDISSKNNATIETLKNEYNIDDSYELEIIEDNGDIKYCWSKMGYDNIINPYDSLTIRIDGLTGEIVTINRFDDEFDTNEINISETTAKNIALKTKDNFSKVTSCQIGYVKPNFFWKDTNKIYEDVKMVRLVYDITIDDIYKVYIDTKTGENIGGDIIKATNNARAYAYSGFQYSTESRNLANTYLKKLGYSSSSVGINNTFESNPVLSFVQNDTKAYGLYIDCHGSTTTLATNSQTILTTNQVKGNWHFVFLDACSTAANSNWSNAFKINSNYSKRAFFGWTTSVYTDKSYDFCRYFWPETTNRDHSNNVRDAAVWAADQVPNNSDGSASTPIKFYGDRSYNGRAY